MEVTVITSIMFLLSVIVFNVVELHYYYYDISAQMNSCFLNRTYKKLYISYEYLLRRIIDYR